MKSSRQRVPYCQNGEEPTSEFEEPMIIKASYGSLSYEGRISQKLLGNIDLRIRQIQNSIPTPFKNSMLKCYVKMEKKPKTYCHIRLLEKRETSKILIPNATFVGDTDNVKCQCPQQC